MENFIKKGGGFVGIHSAADTEYEWEWYGNLVGAYFKSHPPVTTAEIQTINNKHISTKHLDDLWKIKDEWYNYKNIKSSAGLSQCIGSTSLKLLITCRVNALIIHL